MTEQEYMKALREAKGSRLNDIIMAVNARVHKNEAGLKNEFEKMFFDRLVAEADEYEKRGGVRPQFDMCEIESDDQRLDIYGNKA